MVVENALSKETEQTKGQERPTVDNIMEPRGERVSRRGLSQMSNGSQYIKTENGP